MKFLGIFKRGDTVKYSVNFHDDTGATANPANALVRWKRPDDVYFNVFPSQIDSKTGWWGHSLTPDASWPLGVYEGRFSGQTNSKERATILCFQLTAASMSDIALLLGEPGTVLYADAFNGALGNDGLTPASAKQTIAAALALMPPQGGTLVVGPGNYIETIDFALSKSHLILKPGAVINHVSLVPLTISGDENKLTGWGAVTQAGAGSPASLRLSGEKNLVEGLIMEGGIIGAHIMQQRNRMEDCIARLQSANPDGGAFIMQTSYTILRRCLSVQQNAGVRGFFVGLPGGPV